MRYGLRRITTQVGSVSHIKNLKMVLYIRNQLTMPWLKPNYPRRMTCSHQQGFQRGSALSTYDILVYTPVFTSAARRYSRCGYIAYSSCIRYILPQHDTYACLIYRWLTFSRIICLLQMPLAYVLALLKLLWPRNSTGLAATVLASNR